MSVVLGTPSRILRYGSTWLTWQANAPAHTPYVDLQFRSNLEDPETSHFGRPDGWWVQLSAEPNTWRYYNASPDWVELFYGDGTFAQTFGTYQTIKTPFDCVGYGYTDEVIMMPGLFRECDIVNCVTIDTSNCIDLASMFSTSGIVATPDLNTSKCRDFNCFCADCHNLTSAGNMDTSSGECFVWMFHNCENLASIHPISLKRANDTYVSPHNIAGPGCTQIFAGCSSLTSPTVYGGANLGDWRAMFYMCDMVNPSLDLDWSSCVDSSGIFNSCTSLETFPTIRNIRNRADISSTPVFSYSFYECTSIDPGAASLYNELVSKGYTAQNTKVTSMFAHCNHNGTIPAAWGGNA